MFNLRMRRSQVGFVAVVAVITGLMTHAARAAQVDANWLSGTSNWNLGSHWSSAIVPNNGNGGNTYRVFIDHGVATASFVSMDLSPQIDTLTIDAGDSLEINNSQTLAIVGGFIANNGSLFISSAGSFTDLKLDADLSLTGSGTVFLSNSSVNRIRSDVATRRLTNVSNTIRGAGNIGFDSMALTNQGIIQASLPTPLTIDPSAAGAINTGTLRAVNGGTLVLANGSFDNTNGTIEAQDTSTVSINSSLVTSGILTTSGSGVVNLQSSTLANPTNNGQLNIPNGNLGAVTGTVTNNAAIALNSGGSFTDLRIDSDVTLTGSGTVAMSNSSPNRIRSDTATLRLTNVNNTIRGSGSVGYDSMALSNQGLIQADQTTALTIDPSASGVINTGTLRATAGATLNLSGGNFTNAGGTIEAQAGSNVTLGSALIDGGVLATAPTGVVQGTNSTLQNVTNTGNLAVNNAALIALQGTMTNNATIGMNSSGSNTDLRMDTDVILNGGGTLAMSNASPNRIFALPSTNRLTNVNNLIRGSGQIGVDQLALTNQSVIQADQSTPLTIDPNVVGVINTGTLRATNNATLNLVNGNFTNTGGTIEAQNGSAVSMSLALIDGGLLTTSGTGVVTGTQSTLKDVTNNGTVLINNSQLIALNGTGMTNSGAVNMNSGGSVTDLRIDADISLTGGGVVNMSNAAPNRIFGSAGNLRLTNVNNTIRGSGQIGVDQMALTNQSIIQADQPTALTIDPSASGAINAGTMQALSGGTLNLSSGTFDNAAGTILAQTGSTVNLNSALIIGGILNTSGTGTVFGNSSMLQNVINNGSFVISNSQTSSLSGTSLTNAGTVTLNSGGSNTNLQLNSDINLTGGGTVVLSNAAPNRIFGLAGSNRLTNINNTIRGSGQIGVDQMALTNQSLIQADPGNALTIDPSASGAINIGTMRAAAGGATLALLNGNFDNAGGTIEAQNGSIVTVTGSSITGGVLTTSGSGVVSGFGSLFTNLTNNGQLLFSNSQTNMLTGSITNNANFSLSSGGSNTDIRIDSDVDLFGPGNLTLSDATPNRMYGLAATFRLTNYGNTIQGAGQIGLNQMALTNWGKINANASNTLTIDVTDSTTFDNHGQINVTGTGGLVIAPGGFTTSGYVTIDAGRQLTRSGVYDQTGGITTVNGSLSPSGGMTLSGGLLKGNGTTFFGVNNTGGTVLPGSSPGQLTISGGYTQSTGGSLYIELGGLTPVTQHDVLNVVGAATLAGSLRVDAVNGFVPTLGQTFVVLNATTRTGTFSSIQTFGFPVGLTVQAIYNPTNVTLQVASGSGARLGDMNCDNVLSLLDIPPFIEAVLDPASFNANHPGCSILHADMNADGSVDGRDVAGFARCSTGGPCP